MRIGVGRSFWPPIYADDRGEQRDLTAPPYPTKRPRFSAFFRGQITCSLLTTYALHPKRVLHFHQELVRLKLPAVC